MYERGECVTIEGIALEWARKWLDDFGYNHIGNDEQIKQRMDILYPGGWSLFQHETFEQVVA